MTSWRGSTNGWGVAVAEAKPLFPLTDDQRAAADPLGHAWVSASAGTGKTQVLTARVLRLLLAGAEPSSILCITFTKAGAAEMAERLNERLARWVRLKDEVLRKDLFAIGAPHRDDQVMARARTLFARVLEAPGGLRIQTIHAFAGSLLASFPVEAGVSPGFVTLDERSDRVLRQRVLAEAVTDAEAEGDAQFLADLETLGVRMGEGGALGLIGRLMARGGQLDVFSSREAILPRLKRFLDVPADGPVEQVLAEACATFDCRDIEVIAAANRAWGTATGLGYCNVLALWLARSGVERAATLDDLLAVVATQKGDPRKVNAGQEKADPDYALHAERLRAAVAALIDLRERAALAERLAGALRVGWTLARGFVTEKRRLGAVDYDDLIDRAARLLDTEGMGAWVRYKLDQRIDHVLVDEAQDTNARQWTIARRLTEEYFAGEGTTEGRRTLFAVGDFKQAIFSFQGTDPLEFSAARDWFQAAAARVRDALSEIDLAHSFRSTQTVLGLVDAVLDGLGHAALGLDRPIPPHRAARGDLVGEVILLPPVTAVDAEDATGEEDWMSDADRLWAQRLARQIGTWLGDRAPMTLAARGRRLRPEDVLVLVRSRGEFASLLVARLHEEGVPIAGVDRLRLTQPLAVRDLIAVIRFALQPEDDLNLAALLVSPFIGWDQERLFGLAHGRTGSLWRALRGHDPVAGDWLGRVLAMADYAAPYEFLEALLSGPLGGRARLLARLGEEARDPIDELLNAALQFEAANPPSLQAFLDWIERDEVDVKRDPSAPQAAIRIMTVHGAKGLQAPLVILADATRDPDNSRADGIEVALAEGESPLFLPISRGEALGPLGAAWEARARRDREEHWRLLYVALTRAEDVLVVGGALGPRARGETPAESWHRTVEAAMERLGARPDEDDLDWPGTRRLAGGRAAAARRQRLVRVRHALPPALLAPPPAEPRPPRPLAPSSLGTDDAPVRPFGPSAVTAARRGSLIHALFERLPTVPPAERAAIAERWLAGAGREPDPALRAAMIAEVLAILGDPGFADLFSPAALAEAPVAATVDGIVIAGTVDRLVVGGDHVRLVDFKTGSSVPAGVEAVPAYHVRQMAAYAAALGVVFPGRRVEAALLYTAGPRLIVLPADLLARYKPGYAAAEQS